MFSLISLLLLLAGTRSTSPADAGRVRARSLDTIGARLADGDFSTTRADFDTTACSASLDTSTVVSDQSLSLTCQGSEMARPPGERPSRMRSCMVTCSSTGYGHEGGRRRVVPCSTSRCPPTVDVSSARRITSFCQGPDDWGRRKGPPLRCRSAAGCGGLLRR